MVFMMSIPHTDESFPRLLVVGAVVSHADGFAERANAPRLLDFVREDGH
jgi:hypothetical protein